jgi:protoporphyrinogen oxidase
MDIGIVGAGIAGLSAAYDLLNEGHTVTVYEANAHAGGLAAGFRDPAWDWHMEHFYHHLFQTDDSMIKLVGELGIDDKLFFRRPITSTYYQGKIYPFDSALRILQFPPFNLIRYARFGLVTILLRYIFRDWQKLEQTTADEWMRRWYGDVVYETSWRPLLINKFGPYFQEVNMAWMWARMVARSFSLGYFEGGFQTLVDALVGAVEGRGGQLRLKTPVTGLSSLEDGRLSLESGAGQAVHDRVLATTSPQLLARLAPALSGDYLGKLLDLKSMGAVVMVFALDRQFFQDGTYWLNVPASSADKLQNTFPFLALVEHTNFVDNVHYNGDHLLYCGDYVPPEHPYLEMSQEDLSQRFTSHFAAFNSEFRPDWIRQEWLFRTRYAQPVPLVNHSQYIPAIQTPLPNLYFASMSQVYPWDRGTNFAVEIGRRAAAIMLGRDVPSASWE